MVQFVFADEMKRACRYCATIARASPKTFIERGGVPEPSDGTATVTFIRFEARTYAVTAKHVITTFSDQAAKNGNPIEVYCLPAAKGAVIQPPFVAAPENWPTPAPDIVLRPIDHTLLARIDKEAFELRQQVAPTFPIPYAAAVGFPTIAKSLRKEPLGDRLAMQCVHAIAEGIPSPEHADQIQFFSEIEVLPEIGSLSGISGGPVFWSDENRFGLLGFVKEALDVTPREGEETIHAGPRVHFLAQHASYETFGRWAEHTDREWPKLREKLNRTVAGKSGA
jgi:hypothetical protein